VTSIQADPDDLERHGKAFDGHVADMTAVHDQLSALINGDIGIGHDAFSRGFRQNYLQQVLNLADSVKGARDGVRAISQGMIKMAGDYRAVDDASLKGITNLGNHLTPPPASGGDVHSTPHKP
jgi:hypothetical protein